MFLLSFILATHVPQELYLKCDDYQWLKTRTLETNALTPRQKFNMIVRWATHTDSKCFEDNK